VNQVDVPSPINLQVEGDAKKWERSAMQRPFRKDFIEVFGNELEIINKSSLKVLELGSGPGFLASELLLRFNDLEITCPMRFGNYLGKTAVYPGLYF